MLQLLQMVEGHEPVAAEPIGAEPRTGGGPEMVLVEAGDHRVGAEAGGFAYDNERPRHPVALPAFEIDRAPVTNGAYVEFMQDTGTDAPMYWEPDGEGGWVRTAMGRHDAVDPDHPAIHVSWHEAHAFAR
jgi:iron(II)-dependent oxidoreductase